MCAVRVVDRGLSHFGFRVALAAVEEAPKRSPTAASNTNGLPHRSVSTKHADLPA